MDKVIELARKCGAGEPESLYGRTDYVVLTKYELERFYELARADLEAEIFRLREHIIDQTKLEQEISQLRKERQGYKDVTEYQKAENAKLKAALQRVATSENSALDLAYCKGVARAALGETK